MTRMDRWMLAGAWTVMAVVGVVGVWKTLHTPRIQAWVLASGSKLAPDPRIPLLPAPPPIPHWNGLACFGEIAPARPVPEGAEGLPLRIVEVPVRRKIRDYAILPLPVLGEAKADLDGARITWTLLEPQVELMYWMNRISAKPVGFLVERRREDGKVEQIARLGPEARSFSDLSAEPTRTYRYWVLSTGDESNLSTYPPVLEPVAKRSMLPAEARTPSAVRVHLVGGDRSTAFLRVETYDRTQKKWIPKTVMAAPGKDVGSSGWTLKALRFDNFTLVADVSDDAGVDRVLTTKD
jgi:hypothetical protein